MMSKKKIILAVFLSFCIITGIWGCSIVTVYENESMNAVITDSDDENGVTDKIYCEELNTSFGEKALAFIDETVDQAGIYLEVEDVIYWWSFEGDFNKEDIISFINTLEE